MHDDTPTDPEFEAAVERLGLERTNVLMEALRRRFDTGFVLLVRHGTPADPRGDIVCVGFGDEFALVGHARIAQKVMEARAEASIVRALEEGRGMIGETPSEMPDSAGGDD